MAFGQVAGLSDALEDYPGYFLKFYESGTTTPLSMATDSSGGTLIAKAEISSGGTVPIGFLKTAGDAIFIPYLDAAYDAFLIPTAAEADANDLSSAIQIADDVTPAITFSDSSQIYATVAALKAGSPTIGNTVQTQGYNTAGDFGAATYLVAAGQSVDGFGDHTLANGNVALIQRRSSLFVETYGLVGDFDYTNPPPRCSQTTR